MNTKTSLFCATRTPAVPGLTNRIQSLSITVSLIMTFLMIFSSSSKAQSALASALLAEDFTYSAGSALTANGWSAHSSPGTNALVTSAPSLTLTGYAGSGIGNAVSLTTSGEDVNRSFATQTSGDVYAAFLVNVSNASTAGDYFFHLGPDPMNTSFFRARVFVRKDASNNLSFGLSKASTGADIVYSPFSYSMGTTYLIVVKYSIVAGTTNDVMSMTVSTDVPSSEPSATVTAADTTAPADMNPGTVAIRQGTAASAPTLKIDGIRVGTSWQDVTQAAVVHTQHVSDYDGNGRTDYVIARELPSAGNPLQWWILFNGTNSSTTLNWGSSLSDFYVPADYDGDGKTDVAIWRQNGDNSAFYILQSETNTIYIRAFGQNADDSSVVGDYDGDGKADLAVYRSAETEGGTSYWFFLATKDNPSQNITYMPWGTANDLPVPGDYDGDGKYDFAITRDDGDGNAIYWTLKSGGGVDVDRYGLVSDWFVPGDYDGDGKTDLAVVRGVNGAFQWFYRPSTTGVVSAAPAANWGADNGDDTFVQGDYDGDGKTDFAIFRFSTATFWVRTSGGSQYVIPWGQAGDNAPASFNYR